MLSGIDINDITNELLTELNYNASFNCSIDDELGLNEFYHSEAVEFQKERLGITYQFHYHGKIIGFVTLAMSHIQRQKLPSDDQLSIRLSHYPAMLLGRLASDNSVRGLGVGTYLLKWSIGVAMTFSNNIGCRYLILQTNENRSDWYLNTKRGMNLLKVIPKQKQSDDWWFFKRLDIQ